MVPPEIHVLSLGLLTQPLALDRASFWWGWGALRFGPAALAATALLILNEIRGPSFLPEERKKKKRETDLFSRIPRKTLRKPTGFPSTARDLLGLQQ